MRAYTGSVYSDPTLFKDFHAGNVINATMIVIKDHSPCDNCVNYAKVMLDEEKKELRSVRVCDFCDQIHYFNRDENVPTKYNHSTLVDLVLFCISFGTHSSLFLHTFNPGSITL